MNTHNIKAVCEHKLSMEFRAGGHYVGWYFLHDVKAARLTVPMGRKEVPPKTLKSMAEQLKLTVAEFKDLIACPLTRADYEQILTERTG